MSAKQQLINQIFNDYLETLNYAHKKLRDDDDDEKLYERIIYLEYCKQYNKTDEVIKNLKKWITESNSMIAYFCFQNEKDLDFCSQIEKSLEAIIVSHEKEIKEIGIDEETITIAKERLKNVKNGMDDPNVK
jgi:hypothetical protein